MSHKTYAALFGIVLLVVGILGFIPMFTPNGYLFDIFRVDQMHSGFHVLSGIAGLLVAMSAYYSRMYFKVLGIIYIFLAFLGLLMGEKLVLLPLNFADNVLHLVIGAIAIYLGFGKQRT